MPIATKPKSQSQSQRQEIKEEPAKKEAKKQASVTFMWNRSVQLRKLVLRSAHTIYVDGGSVIDPEAPPAIRVEVKNGVFETDKPHIIELLKAHEDFNKKNIDGFRIYTAPTAQDKVQSILDAHGMTAEDLLSSLTEK